MKVALIAALSGALVAVGAQALPSAIGASEDSSGALVKPAATRTVEDAGARREDRRADRRADRRKDRRADRREDRREDRRIGAREPGEDVRGPCDEAEHAGDPRCTGAQVPEDRGADDRRADDGPAHDRGDDHGADDRGDDHGGGGEVDNSGPGSSSSGHGGGGDDD